MFAELGALVDATPVKCVSVSDGVWSLLAADAAALPGGGGGAGGDRDGLAGEPIDVPSGGAQPPIRAPRRARLPAREGAPPAPPFDAFSSPGNSGRMAIDGPRAGLVSIPGPRLESPEDQRAMDAALHGYIPETVVQHLKASHQVTGVFRPDFQYLMY